jgi:hypothetical protein
MHVHDVKLLNVNCASNDPRLLGCAAGSVNGAGYMLVYRCEWPRPVSCIVRRNLYCSVNLFSNICV